MELIYTSDDIYAIRNPAVVMMEPEVNMVAKLCLTASAAASLRVIVSLSELNLLIITIA